jgi:GR25 family glycosyltransferase involved in LPS biosynthesis
MSLYDKINNIYFINLEKSTDRKKHIINNLKTYFPDKKIIRFDAVDSEDIKKYFLSYVKRLNMINSKTMYNVFGCYFSHLCLLKYLSLTNKNNDKFSLIFEDDSEIDFNFINLLKQNSKFPDDFNVILGVQLKKNKLKNNITYVKNNYKYLLNKIDDDIKPYIYGTSIVIYNNNKLNYIYNKLLENIINKSHKEIDMCLIYYIQNVYFFNINLLISNKYTKNSTIY